MRHDAHYVEELSSQSPTSIGRLIAVDALDPNPEQPRVEIGDLTELTTSPLVTLWHEQICVSSVLYQR